MYHHDISLKAEEVWSLIGTTRKALRTVENRLPFGLLRFELDLPLIGLCFFPDLVLRFVLLSNLNKHCDFFALGNYYSLRSQHEKAALYFQRALKLNPRYLGAWTLMGHEYMEMKNTSAAIQAYRYRLYCTKWLHRDWSSMLGLLFIFCWILSWFWSWLLSD